MSITEQQLEKVNKEVNSTLVFTSDIEQWNNIDKWDDGLETGKDSWK